MDSNYNIQGDELMKKGEKKYKGNLFIKFLFSKYKLS